MGGGNNGATAGGGGRISLYSDDWSAFSGRFRVGSGQGTSPGGAGTVFLYDNQGGAHLWVSNEGLSSPEKGTPLRQVGRHSISEVSEADGQTTLTVSGSPWPARDDAHDWGLDGVYVDPDIADSQTGHFLIIDNSENTLTIEATGLGDLSGKELQGVHVFKSLKVLDGAYVDLGTDRLAVEGDNITIDNGKVFYDGTLDEGTP